MCAPMIPTDQHDTRSNAAMLREKAEAAYDELLTALRVRHKLLRDIDDGVRASRLSNGLLDERLKRVNRIAAEAEYAYQQAANSLMLGEPGVCKATSLSLAVAMQIRVGRNEKAAGMPVPAARLPAVVSPGALA